MVGDLEPAAVSCYSGHRYAQEPRRFVWRGEEHAVAAVIRTWREPEGLAFLVEDAEGRRWRLHYVEAEGRWLARPG